MRRSRFSFFFFIALLSILLRHGTSFASEILPLLDRWELFSSTSIEGPVKAAKISREGFESEASFETKVPSTILAALVEAGVYPDPYFGENLKHIPGYVEGRWLIMPKDSPFYPSWWYRRSFQVPETWKGRHVMLHLDGVNYKANVWLNGKQIGESSDVDGMFRRFQFDVTRKVQWNKDNILAVEVLAPGKLEDKDYQTKQIEATTGWDDHNPQPPDMNMGLWQDVYLTATGAVRIQHPHVASDLEIPSLSQADLTVSCELLNQSRKAANCLLKGQIGDIAFEKKVVLDGAEKRFVVLDATSHPQLHLTNPEVWWPHPVGKQALHELDLQVLVNEKPSDTASVRFGIRKAETFLNEEGWRVYKINGKKLLIRGGAWMTCDMLLRLEPERYEALIRYAREAYLNMLRSEGFSIRETDCFYDLCDEMGIMVTQQIFGRSIPDEALAVQCIEDTILRIRNHPSLVHFLGHDETFPTRTLDKAYRELIERYAKDRSYQPHSGTFHVSTRVKTGGTRTGTRQLWTYAAPSHYYTHKNDGAWGFAQSGGIGGIVAPLESIQRMLPEGKQWPISTDAWSFHTVIQGHAYFDAFLKAMERRYGAPSNLKEFSKTAEVMNYNSARGMFEAYARNKYEATGITTWKYDAAWPAAMTWQFVDWYLLPTAAYFGAQKACEPLHVQYAYDDRGVYVVNGYYETFPNLTVHARIVDITGNERFSKSERVDVVSDGKALAFKVPALDGLSSSYFLSLSLSGKDGTVLSRNLYWLSTSQDAQGSMGHREGVFFVEPRGWEDHRELCHLPDTRLEVQCQTHGLGENRAVSVQVHNPTDRIAFFVRLAATRGSQGYEIAPSYWNANCLSLLPGETQETQVRFKAKDLNGEPPQIRWEGWNVKREERSLAEPVARNVTSPQASPSTEPLTFKAGVAKKEITNENPLVMVNGNVSQGTLRPLYARALSLNDGSSRLLLVTYDLNCLDHATPILRKRVQEELDIEPSRLILLATHNHNAPIQINPDNFPYGKRLADLFFDLIQEAIANEKGPARVLFGNTYGYFLMGVGNAPVDHEIQLLKVVRDEKPIALFFNHGTHPAQASDQLVGAGHPGYAMDEIEKELPGVQAMYAASGAGNQFPLGAAVQGIRGAEERCRAFGHLLAKTVLQTEKGNLEDVTGKLNSTMKTLSLPLAEPITKEEAKSQAKSFPKDVGFVPYPHKHRKSNWVRMVLHYYDKGIPFPKRTTDMICSDDTYLIHREDENLLRAYDYSIHEAFPCVYEEVIVAQIGPMPFVAMQGEICAPIVARIKDAFRSTTPILVNGYMGEHNLYIPTRELVRLKAYQAKVIQTQYACPVGWAPEVEDQMVRQVVSLVRSSIR